LIVGSEAQIEESPRREVASGQGTHGRTRGHVFVLRLGDGLVIGLELVKHADPLSEDGSGVLDGEVDRVERVDEFTFDQADCLTLLQCLDGLENHGCGLPKLADEFPVLRESLQELVADVPHRRASRASLSRSGWMAFPRIRTLLKIVFGRSSFNGRLADSSNKKARGA